MSEASILLAEDVDFNQELFADMIGRLGHRVQIASDGVEAVDLARRLQSEPDAWDLILMDLHMPIMGGLAATRAIRSLGGRAATIPIIALTGSGSGDERQQCEAAGMNDHLPKPVGNEALRQMINRWRDARDESFTTEPALARSPSLEGRIKARLRSSVDRLGTILEEIPVTPPTDRNAVLIEARRIAHIVAGTAGMVGEKALGDIAAAAEAEIAAAVGAASSSRLKTARSAIERLVVAQAAPSASSE